MLFSHLKSTVPGEVAAIGKKDEEEERDCMHYSRDGSNWHGKRTEYTNIIE